MPCFPPRATVPGRPLALIPLRRRTVWQAASQYYVRSLAFSPDGRELFTAGYDDNVWRWDLTYRGGPKGWKAYRTDDRAVD